MDNNYPIEEHVHRYACWTAARAASISRFSNNEMIQFIQENDLRNELAKIKKFKMSSDQYMDWFVRMTEGILTSMENYSLSKEKKVFRNISFGIAAKVVNIYVKTSEVITSGGLSSISKVAIPPVDSYLLKGLNLKSKAWSKLKKEEYMALINELKIINKDQPFWKLEYYWNLNNK